MSDAASWALEIDRDWAAQMGDLHGAVEYIGLQAIRRIDMRSPVDTGRFRGNWTLSFGAADGDITAVLDPSGSATVARNTGMMTAYPREGFPVIYLQNNLPYAERLEQGYSTQAPSGMVGITVADLAAIWEATEI